MSDRIQINFRIDKRQLKLLKQLAREKSFKEKQDVLYTDLIREAITSLLKKC